MIEFVVRKKKITILIFVICIIGGVYNFFAMPKQETPDITSYSAVVTTVLPGATPENIENTVTKKVEDKIKEIQGIKSITSDSRESVSIVTVELNKNQKPKEKWNELRKKVQDVEAGLPEAAKKPQVNDDLAKSYVQTLNITSDSLEELYNARSYIDKWKDQIKTVQGVADVTVVGLPEKQVRVDLDTQKMYNYGVSWKLVAGAIKGDRDKTPLGNLDNENHRYQLKLDESYEPKILNQIIVSTTKEGNPIYLSDIGKAYMSTEKVDHYVYHNGKPAVGITINCETGIDIPSTQKKVTEKLDSFKNSMPAGIQFENVYSINERLNEMFSSLAKEMIIAIASVLIVCSLGLSFIDSLMVAIAIPISMSIGFMLAPAFGVTFNQMTIYALIIVLGILVDDAVVVNDNIDRHILELGESVEEAAINGPKEVIISILTATLATICTFVPIAFLPGMTGEFARPLPVIVSLSMLASMAMALTIIPIFRQWYGKREGKKDKNKPAGLLGNQIKKLTNIYVSKFMPKVLKNPLKFITAATLITLVAYSLISIIPMQLFPKADRAEFLINVTNQTGSSIKDTNVLVEDVSKWVSSQPNVELVSAYAGGPAPAMFAADENIEDKEQSGQIVVKIDTKKESTERLIDKWNEQFKELYPKAEVVSKSLQAGFSVGKPVEIRIYGEDVEKLRDITQEVEGKLKAINGVTNVKNNIGIDNYSYKIEVNKALMDKMHVNYSDITSTIRLVNDGIVVDKFEDKNDVSDIVIYANKSNEDPMVDFEKLSVPNALGEQIPLKQLVKITPDFSINSIPHRNLERYVQVSASVTGKTTAASAMKEIKQEMNKIELPDGYTWEAGGETVESVDIFADLIKLLAVAAILIIVLIILQFYSFSIPAIIASTFLLAFGGSLIGLFITGKSLGFMAMLGVITLIGIVARNGIVLIEFIENERKNGVEINQAVINAGEARLRPVMLTAIIAIVGLVPMAVNGEVLFKPMAVSIIFGLMYATILTLVVVPAIYVIIDKMKIKFKNSKVKADNVK
ncbi:nodulation protein NolG [Clostridium gelidum]|uniref:Nodulation protein NolG n=1 Tax=Clostridium gelidum TaxID=704125 RepID=A0ABM7T956_9CLOT|nr:efflux RND transporter permease subunit [Clostridium gelidum]BCZ45452.1 nodulation protein NolG [Clostridium gelidum]